MARKQEIEDRLPKIGDIVIYKHHDRDEDYPAIITKVGRDEKVCLVFFGYFGGFSEHVKDKLHGHRKGEWIFKEEADLVESYDKSFAKR